MDEHYLQKEVYRKVREGDEIFEFLQSGSLDGIWYWDLEDQEQEWLSPRFKALFGYEDHEIPHTSTWWQENIFPEDLPGVQEMFRRHLEEDQPYDQIVRYRHKDGSTVWVRCRGLAIRDENGKPIRMLGAHTDMTRLMRAREELQKAHAELEEHVAERTAELSKSNESLQREVVERKRAEQVIVAKNRELEMLLHVSSHDLREPLRAIENFSDLLGHQYFHSVDDKGRDFLRRISRGAARMSSLLDDILELSRARQIGERTEEVSGGVIVKKALARLGSKIRETNAKVRVEADLPRLRADKTWATEAVYNVVANALKFTREDEAPEVEIAAYRPVDGDSSQIGIVVKDRGPGVPAEHAAKIFHLFQRLVGRAVEGTGAGLAIVKEVAERHGGRAWVQARQGGGSEFVITFATAPATGGVHEENPHRDVAR